MQSTLSKCKAHVALGDTTSTVFNTTMFCKKLNLCYVGTWIVCSVISALAMLQVLCGPSSDVLPFMCQNKWYGSGLSGEHGVIVLGKILRYGSTCRTVQQWNAFDSYNLWFMIMHQT